MDKIPVIAVVGATASGKTALAVKLAAEYDGEVISADSMQIYRGMDIATAKPDEAERSGIPHHLMDFLPVTECYSVARFAEEAKAVAFEIHSRGKVPVIAGGTGLYVDSLINNITFEEEPDNTAVRQGLNIRRDTEGIEALFEELKSIDPETASCLHINNEKRVLRALEVYYLTGETFSARMRRSKLNASPFDPVFIGLDYADRSVLYERINRRVDIMLEKGLVEEARNYFSLPCADTASQAIGYKELKGYFDGTLTLEEAADNLKKATRHYAKRQITWFGRNESVNRIYCDNKSADEIAAEAVKIIEGTGKFVTRRKNT